MRLFQQNITRAGRLVRAAIAAALAIAGVCLLNAAPWAAIVLFASSAFVFFEAARGWCVMRACGIKTRL